MSGAKKKLEIRRVNTSDDSVQELPAFSAMLNPAKYTRARSVRYTNDEDWKGSTKELRIDRISAETLELDELVLDGTGIVDAPDSERDVDAQLALLRRMLHEPIDPKVRHAVVEIRWGPLSFRGRLTAMKVDYTLFSAAGKPLRARVKLSFMAYEKSSKALAVAVAAAPQARQIRLVGGDSLPLMCFTAYNDSSLCTAVALFNGLTTIRRQLPGTLLTLPKLR